LDINGQFVTFIATGHLPCLCDIAVINGLFHMCHSSHSHALERALLFGISRGAHAISSQYRSNLWLFVTLVKLLLLNWLLST